MSGRHYTKANWWWPGQGNTTGTNTAVAVTWVEPTPTFKGWARIVFAVDEWAHRHGLVMVNHKNYLWLRRPWTVPLGWLCNWWDRKLLGQQLVGALVPTTGGDWLEVRVP